MNWTGGSKNRLAQQIEANKQREFFERSKRAAAATSQQQQQHQHQRAFANVSSPAASSPELALAAAKKLGAVRAIRRSVFKDSASVLSDSDDARAAAVRHAAALRAQQVVAAASPSPAVAEVPRNAAAAQKRGSLDLIGLRGPLSADGKRRSGGAIARAIHSKGIEKAPSAQYVDFSFQIPSSPSARGDFSQHASAVDVDLVSVEDEPQSAGYLSPFKNKSPSSKSGKGWADFVDVELHDESAKENELAVVPQTQKRKHHPTDDDDEPAWEEPPPPKSHKPFFSSNASTPSAHREGDNAVAVPTTALREILDKVNSYEPYFGLMSAQMIDLKKMVAEIHHAHKPQIVDKSVNTCALPPVESNVSSIASTTNDAAPGAPAITSLREASIRRSSINSAGSIALSVLGPDDLFSDEGKDGEIAGAEKVVTARAAEEVVALDVAETGEGDKMDVDAKEDQAGDDQEKVAEKTEAGDGEETKEVAAEGDDGEGKSKDAEVTASVEDSGVDAVEVDAAAEQESVQQVASE